MNPKDNIKLINESNLLYNDGIPFDLRKSHNLFDKPIKQIKNKIYNNKFKEEFKVIKSLNKKKLDFLPKKEEI